MNDANKNSLNPLDRGEAWEKLKNIKLLKGTSRGYEKETELSKIQKRELLVELGKSMNTDLLKEQSREGCSTNSLLYVMLMQFIRAELCLPNSHKMSLEGFEKGTQLNRKPIFNLDAFYLKDCKSGVEQHFLLNQFKLLLKEFYIFTVEYLAQKNRPQNSLLAEAKQLVQWHFQWMLIHDFLKTIVDEGIVNDVLKNGNQFFNLETGDIPKEFTFAAFCLETVLTPSEIQINQEDKISGFQELFTDKEQSVSWKHLLSRKNNCRKINSFLSLDKACENYATSILELGWKENLLTGQQWAKKMGLKPLDKTEILDHSSNQEQAVLLKENTTLLNQTPLWFYILKESAVLGEGEKLGPLGGRIVTEVIVGTLQTNMKNSFLSLANWQPYMGSELGHFTLNDLVQYSL